MKTFQTIREPGGGAVDERYRLRTVLAEMRPVVQGEAWGPAPNLPLRFEFVCDSRIAERMTTVGYAYGEDKNQAPENGELVKVNGVMVRVLNVVESASYNSRYYRYEIEIERASA